MKGVEGGDMSEFFNWLCSGWHGVRKNKKALVGRSWGWPALPWEMVIKLWAAGDQVAKGWKSIVISVIDEHRMSLCGSVPGFSWDTERTRVKVWFQKSPLCREVEYYSRWTYYSLSTLFNHVPGGWKGWWDKANNPTRWSDKSHLWHDRKWLMSTSHNGRYNS